MGTRNLTVVVHKGEVVIAQYGQWDGYPDGQGATALEFLQNMDRNKFVSQLEKVKFMDEAKEKEVADFVESITGDKSGWMTMEQAEAYHKKYPLLTRDNGAQILQLVYDSPEDTIWLRNEIAFFSDALFNEWTYVIDLDKNILEVYHGFGKTRPEETSRFYNIIVENEEAKQKALKEWEEKAQAAKDAGIEFTERKPYIRDEPYYMDLVATFDISDGKVPTQESFLEYFELNVYNKDND